MDCPAVRTVSSDTVLFPVIDALLTVNRLAVFAPDGVPGNVLADVADKVVYLFLSKGWINFDLVFEWQIHSEFLGLSREV